MIIWKHLMLILPVMVAALASAATAATKAGMLEFTRATKADENANWASVSPAVDAKICQQVAAVAFPARLQAEDWNSGPTHWLRDVLAPNAQLATAVVTNFKQVVKEGQLFVHPRLVASVVE